MLVTLAAVVLIASIAVFFSQEFVRLFKKIMGIPGVKLLLPLVLASLLLETYEVWGYWILKHCHLALHILVYKITVLLPFETGALLLMRVIFLFLFGSAPVWYFKFRYRNDIRLYPKKFSYRLGLTLWIIAAILLAVEIY
jgi:hypothetical protein